MQQSDQIGELAAALAKAQDDFELILKTKTVQVKSDKGAYSFDYAPLEVVMEATGPALRKHGLSLIQPLFGGGKEPGIVRTMLLHSSGQWIASEISLPNVPLKAQELGSLITYVRRYAYSAMLGVTTEEDDDGNAHDGNQVRFQSREPQRSQPVRPSGKPSTPKQHEFLINLMKNPVFTDEEREDTKLWLAENPAMERVSKAIDAAQLKIKGEVAHA
jgi:dsDNA-binding SOS-regulon protein